MSDALRTGTISAKTSAYLQKFSDSSLGYLLEHRCVTKRGKQFTRFAIRGILTNPVYMIADETAYQYLKENHVDLFDERSEFDGELIYTYMCSTKERSHGMVCSMKNCNGNTLDAKIIEEIRRLSANKETLTRLLAQTNKVSSSSKESYDAELVADTDGKYYELWNAQAQILYRRRGKPEQFLLTRTALVVG